MQIETARHLNNGLHHAAVLWQSFDKRFVDFQHIHRQGFHMLKLTQPGVAHTKIVQRDANAGIAQRLQNGNGFVRIVNASALRHFQRQRIRLDPVAIDQLQHFGNHRRMHELQRRQINRQRQRHAALLPGGKLAAGLLQHPITDGDHQATGFNAFNQPLRQLP